MIRLFPPEVKPIDDSPEWSDEYLRSLLPLHYGMRRFFRNEPPPFASAPVRSKPHRTYDPARLDRDPEGDYVPMYLADLLRQQEKKWNALKERIEAFGKSAGLFDELSIRQLGRAGGGDPFQIEVRKGDGRRKGAKRNLTDVGYGVSQVLPVITELLRDKAGSAVFVATAGSASASERAGGVGHAVLRSCCGGAAAGRRDAQRSPGWIASGWMCATGRPGSSRRMCRCCTSSGRVWMCASTRCGSTGWAMCWMRRGGIVGSSSKR